MENKDYNDINLKEDDVIFVVDPEKVMGLNHTLRAEQAYIKCSYCDAKKKLTLKNGIYSSPKFSKRRSMYYGLCLTDECEKRQKEEEVQKQADERFFAQEAYLHERARIQDEKCKALWDKIKPKYNKDLI
jgi:hypothetical protein